MDGGDFRLSNGGYWNYENISLNLSTEKSSHIKSIHATILSSCILAILRQIYMELSIK